MDEIKQFSDNQGLPANEHAKKLAKKQSSQKKQKPEKTIYTVKQGKFLQITVKPNGAYSTYLGSKKTLGEKYDVLLKQYKSQGLLFSELEIDEVCSKIIKDLNK